MLSINWCTKFKFNFFSANYINCILNSFNIFWILWFWLLDILDLFICFSQFSKFYENRKDNNLFFNYFKRSLAKSVAEKLLFTSNQKMVQRLLSKDRIVFTLLLAMEVNDIRTIFICFLLSFFKSCRKVVDANICCNISCNIHIIKLNKGFIIYFYFYVMSCIKYNHLVIALTKLEGQEIGNFSSS